MKVGIARAYNGEHKQYRKYCEKLGIQSFLFDIDSVNWVKNFRLADAYIWQADAREENYRTIHDRVYFIESVFKKPIFPDMNMYYAYNDKIKQYNILKNFGFPTPETYITHHKEQALGIIKKIKYPFILKDAHGYGGYHVYKVENKKQAREFVEKIWSPQGLKHHRSTMKNYFLAQEFLDIEKDLRVITMGDKAVRYFWRIGQDKWKHNLGQGAGFSFENIPTKALRLCEKISHKMGYHWMAYDIFVPKGREPLVSEFACNFTAKPFVREMQIKYIKDFLKK